LLNVTAILNFVGVLTIVFQYCTDSRCLFVALLCCVPLPLILSLLITQNAVWLWFSSLYVLTSHTLELLIQTWWIRVEFTKG